jgi:hypothetical protein
VLGAWFGAQALFGLLALSAFEAGVGPELAARVVARVLGPLELGGAAAGLALALMGGALRRGRVAVGLPLLLAVLCLTSHFGVSPALAEIRLGSPDSPADAGLRFAQLHRLSVGLYLAAVAGVLALGLLHARRECELPGGAS